MSMRIVAGRAARRGAWICLLTMIGCAAACLVAPQPVLAEDAAVPVRPTHLDFTLEEPQEFRGVWERQFQPFLNPIETRSWVNVRVEKHDADTGEVSGHFDFYIRSLCDDVVDEPFKGTFNGKMLRIEYQYQQCPGMKPLRLTLWKEDSGYRGYVRGWPFTVHSVITANAK